MPTGYTAGIVEGKDSFEEFVWGCTRAFGVMMHMRDDSLGAKFVPPGKSFREGNPHKEYLEDNAQDLRDFVDLPREKQVEKVRKRLEESIASSERTLIEWLEENARIDSAIAKMSIIKSPSDEHSEFMKFIRNQLEISRHDTDSLRDWIKRDCDKLNNIEAAVDAHIESLRDRVERSKRSVDEWDQKNDGSLSKQEWLRALNKVVPCPAHMATEEFLEWIK